MTAIVRLGTTATAAMPMFQSGGGGTNYQLAVDSSQSSSQAEQADVTVGIGILVDSSESASQAEQADVTVRLISVDSAESSSQAEQVLLSSGDVLSLDSAESQSESSEPEVATGYTLAVDSAESSSQASNASVRKTVVSTGKIEIWGNVEPVVVHPVRYLVRPITHE